jgi:aryl-alcohol dehydrogenase-like predicted oxidoreductase
VVFKASKTHLRADVIDLFYQHRVDPGVPIEDVAGTAGYAVLAGLIWLATLVAARNPARTARL